MNQWLNEWTVNDWMDGWMRWVSCFLCWAMCFFPEQPLRLCQLSCPLRWGTSSPNFFFSELPLRWLLQPPFFSSRRCYNAFSNLQLQSHKTQGYHYDHPRSCCTACRNSQLQPSKAGAPEHRKWFPACSRANACPSRLQIANPKKPESNQIDQHSHSVRRQQMPPLRTFLGCSPALSFWHLFWNRALATLPRAFCRTWSSRKCSEHEGF